MAVHPCNKRFFDIFRKGISSHGQDWKFSNAVHSGIADFSGGFISVEYRHLYIHKDNVIIKRSMVPNGLYSFLPVFSSIYRNKKQFQHFFGNLTVELIILNQQSTEPGESFLRRCGAGGVRKYRSGTFF